MPRIAIASPYTLPFYCGNSIFAERLREGLTCRGFTVDVYNARRDPPEARSASAPDILHTLNADKSSVWAERFLAGRTLPWVITFTGTDYNGWGGDEPPPHLRKELERASALTVFHEDAAEVLKGAVPETRTRVRVIPQGISYNPLRADRIDVRSRLDIPNDATVFLMVAGIRPVKNLGLAMAAFAQVERGLSQVRLLLVGPVVDREEAGKILAMGSGLRCFSYLGERTPAEVREIMGGADVLLNTSLHEGMPGAFLEAMAEGLPILAGAVPGNTSLVRQGVNGLLYAPGNRAELAGAVIRLTGDSGLRARLGEEGRRIAETEYSAARELDEYCSLYASLLNKDNGVTTE